MSHGVQYTTEAIIEALEKVRGGVYLAAELLGCSHKTIERRAKSVQAVADVIDKHRNRRVDVAELALDTALANKESWAILFTLRTIGKSRGYTEKSQLDITSGDKPIDFSRLSDEQLQRLVKGDDPSRVLPD